MAMAYELTNSRQKDFYEVGGLSSTLFPKK